MIAGEQFYADISKERMDLFEQDVLVFLGTGFAQGGKEAIASDPLIRQLDVFQEGRTVFIPLEYDDALQYGSVLSLEFALANIVPLLAEAVPNAAATFPSADGFPAFTPTPPLIEIVEQRGETLLVRHMMGETEMPAKPQRIYTDASTSQFALSLGLPGVGAQHFTNLRSIPDLAAVLENVTDLGTNTYQANYEATLTQQPDLIIAWAKVATKPEAQSAYEALSAIAPTIVLDGSPFTYWQQAARVLGDALGRTARRQTRCLPLTPRVLRHSVIASAL